MSRETHQSELTRLQDKREECHYLEHSKFRFAPEDVSSHLTCPGSPPPPSGVKIFKSMRWLALQLLLLPPLQKLPQTWSNLEQNSFHLVTCLCTPTRKEADLASSRTYWNLYTGLGNISLWNHQARCTGKYIIIQLKQKLCPPAGCTSS